MLDAVESFATGHQHTIAAIGVLATCSAVIVSLWLAVSSKRASRTQLTARVATSFIIHSSIPKGQEPRYISVSITNQGIMPLRIPFSFFHWRAPFRRGTYFITPYDYSAHDHWVPQQKYPVEIAPRASHTFFVSTPKTFHSEFLRMIEARDGLKPWKLRFMRAIVVTEDGALFRAELDKGIRKELREIHDEARVRLGTLGPIQTLIRYTKLRTRRSLGLKPKEH